MRRAWAGLVIAGTLVAATMAPAVAADKDPGGHGHPSSGQISHQLVQRFSANGHAGAQSVTPMDGLPGSISGTVSAPAGTDLTRIEVYAVNPADPTGQFPASAQVNALGEYSLTGLAPGTYKVYFDALGTALLESQWWNGTAAGAREFASASVVTVASSDVPGKNAQLIVAGGSITGTVTGAATIAAGAVAACTVREDGVYLLERCGPIAADGTYKLASLRPGTFTVGYVTDVREIDSIGWFGRTLWWSDEDSYDYSDDLTVGSSVPAVANENLSTTWSPSLGKDIATFPKISGESSVGKKLTATSGSWPSWWTPSYQWYANGSPISGATTSGYTLKSTELNKKITVQVYAMSDFWGSNSYEYMNAGPTATVHYALTRSTPTISGTRAVGYTLTAHHGTWTTGTTFSYAWYANGSFISGTSGPTHSTFKPTTAQIGKKVTVKVTGSKSGYTTASTVSSPTVKIALTAAPTITGTKSVGSTLTAHHNTWTTGTTFSYAWYANGAYISGTSGPTHSTFKLTSAQRGKTIKVKVTGSLTGYQTISRYSASTVKIT